MKPQDHNPSKHDEPKENLGFDPDSPDLADPQVDPQGPAKSPESGENIQEQKRVKDDQYPPYDSKE
ncbi:DUF6021 family protein [Pseudomonas huanghezhanensis]|uniref:DUF6021 family protein n=1 Tax=Pseudomonas huanghezhanensis TaxID=3002903 RepID=UPI0022860FBE|nr:DUF6021 family protein [Pseudomonas sp. BSw22131]